MGRNSGGWVVKDKNNLPSSTLLKKNNLKNFLLEKLMSIAVTTLSSMQIIRVRKRLNRNISVMINFKECLRLRTKSEKKII